jgi:hypothetical protein
MKMSLKLKPILVLSLLLILNLYSFSQSPEKRISTAAASWTTKINEWLKLNPEKTSQLTKLNEKMLIAVRESYKSVKSNPAATDSEKKAARDKSIDAMQNREKEIKKLLNKDEYALYKAHKKENRAMAQTRIMSNQLDLTPDQESKIETINLEAIKKLPEHDGNKKAAEMSRNEKRELAMAMRKVQQEKEKAYAGVLSAEQMKKYTENRQEAREQMKSRRKSGKV